MNKDITEVRYLGGYQLGLTFEGGEQRDVDVSELVPFEGVFEPLREAAFFGRVAVNSELGTVVWPNGADLCPDVLYERGRIPVVKRTEAFGGAENPA